MNRGIPVLRWLTVVVLALGAMSWPGHLYAQGVTTGSISGVVTDGQKPVAGASVLAIHEPSGTSYEATTRADGRFSIPNMRVGGPYTVQVNYVGTGTAFAQQTKEDVTVNLGIATDLTLSVRVIAVQENVTVIAETDPVFSSARTGAATQISRDDLANLPTISGRLENITRLTPQQSGTMSFAGQDTRANNITVDGSYFNNSFGLGNTPGDRTGVAAISLASIEQVQVSVAPYDVRQGNFVGAAVNTVTRSGTNKLAGSFYRQFRNQGMVGTEAKALTVNPGTFTYGNTGFWASGPVMKNKVFFFGNFEKEALTQPATSFRANNGGETTVGNVTRVLASDLDALAAYLKKNFNYDPGGYQGYNFPTPAKRGVAKGDYNLNNSNKVTFRYTQLNSSTPVLESNSTSLGFGNRRTSLLALNFSASNYSILENIKSGVGEWNAVVGKSMANRIIAGYTTNDESRGDVGKLFPLVDVLDGSGATYTSFGSEPFTPNNELRYHTFQFEDDFTKFSEKHALTFGATFQKYHSENVFFPGKQSVYVYNSLADFYADANDYLANPNHTVSPVSLRRFQVRYINVPGADKPVQPLDVIYGGGYVGDDWSVTGNFKLTPGVRFDVPKFGDTGFDNALADALTFRDENGNAVHYNTKKLPDPKLLWSPRVGFNWDATNDQKTQIRGGTGVFTGPPPYVYISNQIGNTGVLTGLVQPADNTTAFPFNPNPDTYKPKGTPTGAPSATYELALTDATFKFPQIWRSNIAVDRRLFMGWTGTAEYIYNRDVNGIYYINANLPAPQSAFTGADTRPRWLVPAGSPAGTIASRLVDNPQVVDAVVLKNENVGRSWNAAFTLRKTFKEGLSITSAYSYGVAQNIVDPSSIAFGNWSANQISGNPNNAPLGFSTASPGHRVFVASSYSKPFFSFGNTSISAFWDAHTINNASYIFSGDANGDAGSANDLLYIPRNTSEMNFAEFATGGVTYTAAAQAAAWDAYIAQDPYLSKHRGEYAKRNAVFLPLVKRMDLSLIQDLFQRVGGQKHGFQFRIDILNFGNLLNHNWGVSQQLVSNSPLTNPAADANGALSYRMRVINGALMNHTYDQTASVTSDTYRFQLTLKYLFN